ncbi:MAG: hypothetical protein MR598_01915 [Erysipelotrichaceae bacterium]|nr:hypothetical protein [Erysipelotrichaceae bacterium]
MKNNAIKWIYDDAGRPETLKDNINDSVCRSIAIATGKGYEEITNLLNRYIIDSGYDEAYIKNDYSRVAKEVAHKLLLDLGFIWKPTMLFGKGCKVHLRKSELPNGTLIVSISKHLTCIVDGIIHDIYDPSRLGNRCVYGFYYKN